MAKVILEDIGVPVEKLLSADEYDKNVLAMRELEKTVIERREEVAAGWGPKYVERVHKKGKLTTWERIDLLKDPGTKIFPVGTFVNYGLEFGDPPRTSPGAGLVTAFVKVCGRHTVVIANDNTVASGSWWPQTPEKIIRAQEIALRLKVPVIYLIDCSGLNLPEQANTFPGKYGAGKIFKMNSLLSAGQVPQVAGVFGDCIAGGGYMPIISDKVVMTENAYMVIAGAALVKGGKSQTITSLDIGGPDIHVHLYNCADMRAPDDPTAIEMIRREIQALPTSAIEYYRFNMSAVEPRFSTAELAGLMPVDYRMPYDMRQIISRMVDASLFWELLPEIGQEMIVGVGRVSGLYTGFIANNQFLTEHPEDPNKSRPGSLLYQQGIAKISSFSRACNADGIPIVWLQDISGFDIGTEAEKHGLLGYGSDLLYTNSTNTTPMITILLRKASGAGYYAMSGHPYDPVLQLSTPITRLAVMEGRTLAIGAYRTKLDHNFNITTDDPEERAKVEQGMADVEARITKDMDPFRSARQRDTDEIVLLGELRDYLKTIIEMSYQSIGYRRVKTPRIWSLHDMAAMFRRI
jgi:3-methylcrotonyl-CoA carboxylase beta subunit